MIGNYDPNLPAGLPLDFNDDEHIKMKECPECNSRGKIIDYGEGTTCPFCDGRGIVKSTDRTIKEALEEQSRHEL